jgi:hypothetical protein
MSKQLAKLTVKKMIAAATLKTQGELANLLGITSQAISSTVAKGKIPERWFDLFKEKFGVTREELSETPEEKLLRTYGKNPVTSSVGVGWGKAESVGVMGATVSGKGKIVHQTATIHEGMQLSSEEETLIKLIRRKDQAGDLTFQLIEQISKM